MKYNILITGGAGYIGSILVPALLELGNKVTVIDNFIFKQTSLNHLCFHHNFNVIKNDIRIESVIKENIKNKDIIIPLAALVGAPLCNLDPIGASTTNHDAIITMLKLVSKDQIILMPTTNSAYGTGEKDNLCNEESKLRPISKYAIEKVKIEKTLMNHPNTISFRLATVFGFSPRMRIDLLVNDFVYRACKDKFIVLFESQFKRNYIHVRDVAQAFVHSINNYELMKNQIYNVGLSKSNISKLDLCKLIKKHLKEFVFFESSYNKDADQRNYIVSNEKIEKTGYKTKYTIDDGIKELIKGYTMISNSLYSNI